MKNVPLGSIVEVVSGATPKTGVTEYWGGNTQWATPADLSKLHGPYIRRTSRTLTELGVRSCATTVLPAGSVLLSSRAPIGHVAINAVPMATNQGFKSLVPGSEVDAKYLYHWLKSKKEYLQSLGNGATFKELSKRATEQIHVPLPPLEEQRRIAAILDRADALRAKRRQVVTKLDALTSSIFHELFGAGEWPVATLDEVSHGTGEYGANVASVEWSPGNPRYVRITDITEAGSLNDDRRAPAGEPRGWNKHVMTEGDLLFARSGATVGKTYLYRSEDGPCVYAGYLIRFRPKTEIVDPEFLFGVTRTPQYAAWVQSRQNVVAQPNINARQYGRELPIPVPPLALQRTYARRVQRAAVFRRRVQEAVGFDDELFASLQARAFRGEL